MVKAKTTKPHRTDIEVEYPFLKGKARKTIRLRPRMSCDVGLLDSKIGGTIAWPKDEPWPQCSQKEDFPWWKSEPGAIVAPQNATEDDKLHNDNYVGTIQLLKKDLPNVEFRPGADLFQILWCPRDHPDTFSVHARAYWRKVSELVDLVHSNPNPTLPDSMLMPNECSLFPEVLTDYPSFWELDAADAEELEKGGEQVVRSYFNRIGSVPGAKIGGYPNWIQDPEYPICACGNEMEHFITFATDEFEFDTAERWCPMEDLKRWNEDKGSGLSELRTGKVSASDIQLPTGMCFGDAGALYFFVCKQCKEWPLSFVFQCS